MSGALSRRARRWYDPLRGRVMMTKGLFDMGVGNLYVLKLVPT
jgi:hypothetical protein